MYWTKYVKTIEFYTENYYNSTNISKGNKEKSANMSILKKCVCKNAATVENCGLTLNAICSCIHYYCQCGSSPADYVATDNAHYWPNEASDAGV